MFYKLPMSNPATAPADAAQPDPNRAASARLDPAGAGNILRLLHILVAYGRNLVQTLRQERDPADIPWYPFLTGIFGTINRALITIVVIRGLLRALALQARFGRSLPSLPRLPLPAWAAEQTRAGGSQPSRAPSPRKPRVAGWAIPPGWPPGDSSLDRLPTPTPEEEMFADIVEQDHGRPLGVILLDICLELGIVPALMDPAIWAELRLAISLHGGDPAPLTSRGMNTAAPTGAAGRNTEAHSANCPPNLTDNPSPAAGSPTPDHRSQTIGIEYPPWPAPYPQSPLPAGTGPLNPPPGETDRRSLTRDRPTAGPAVLLDFVPTPQPVETRNSN